MMRPMSTTKNEMIGWNRAKVNYWQVVICGVTPAGLAFPAADSLLL
jgi:hypothetical protein